MAASVLMEYQYQPLRLKSIPFLLSGDVVDRCDGGGGGSGSGRR